MNGTGTLPTPLRWLLTIPPLLLLFIVLPAGAAVLTACFSPLDDPGGDGAAGSLQILVGGGGRTVNAELLSYRFEFRGPGGEFISRNLDPPATVVNLTVNPGQWTIHVDAYTPAGSFYAAGDAAVLVESRKAAAVTVPMIRLPPLLDTVAAIDGWIAEAVNIDPDAGTAGAPIPLRAGLALDAAAWAELLAAIDAGGKFLALDLSACTTGNHAVGGGLYGNGVFDPNPGDTDANRTAGKGKIVSLTLPGAATGIVAGTNLDPAFLNFEALTGVSGAAITDVGNSAFWGRAVLSTVEFPRAATIGESAFRQCTALTAVNLPEAAGIGAYAFNGCTGLYSVYLPNAATIATQAFSGTALTTLSLPSVTTIGDNAFNSTVLTALSLPALTSIGNNAFSSVTLTTLDLPAVPPALGATTFNMTGLYAGAGTTLTIRVPGGKAEDYLIAWGAAADTAAGTNATAYGTSHKRIVIANADGSPAPSFLPSIAAVTAYLAAASGGAAATDPIPLEVGLILSQANWEGLLGAINTKGRFVALDLSACLKSAGATGGGLYSNGSFDPNAADTDSGRTAGKGRIVSLILPAAAAAVQDGSTDPTFKGFTALENVTGANITAIGTYAFSQRSSLVTVDFPGALTIGSDAFHSCTGLTAVTLDAATSIGGWAFSGCSALRSVSLRSVTTTGMNTFTSCKSLEALYFGTADPPGGMSVFYDTSGGTSTSITIHVPAGRRTAYLAVWPEAYNGGNEVRYGTNHERVTVADDL
ncbi:MAG: leucine-rich repeat domain-containing protein [Treponema sp.]|jgi:hypothetical protein|nr:leucine-rich repeat domain-containing protein [Treponema sp.]